MRTAFSLAADLVLIVHLAFIVFVLVGGFFLAERRRLRWLHLAAVAWAVAISVFGWTCPLTPLENALLARAGEATYEGGFVARYLLPIIYPDALTPEVQHLMAATVVAINLLAYGRAWLRTQPQVWGDSDPSKNSKADSGKP
ncbi:MAG: DUF2784 domain-containing protein [Casimicrobiaceae bacterium]|nr:DUF2784 domain-containing protein [Casimicrobiaceae bacterium]MCX8098131.1 DUF2784 domain-containing protein [Casimicrobiaceae bacterium]MDW8311669.1 DUF2784 domain-containing protein [Burkholderiales bacterium]